MEHKATELIVFQDRVGVLVADYSARGERLLSLIEVRPDGMTARVGLNDMPAKAFNAAVPFTGVVTPEMKIAIRAAIISTRSNANDYQSPSPLA